MENNNTKVNTKKRQRTLDDSVALHPAPKRVRVAGDDDADYPEVWKASPYYASLKQLVREGWARFPRVVTDHARIVRALEGLQRHLERLQPGLNFATQSIAEIRRHLPESIRGIFQQLRAGHVQEVCDLKYAEEVEAIFRLIWVDADGVLPGQMIASSDAVSMMLPKYTQGTDTQWAHVDQSPHRTPLHPYGATCYQGLIVATHQLVPNADTGRNEIVLVPHTVEDGGLTVLPGSVAKYREVMAKEGITKIATDWHKFDRKGEASRVASLYGHDNYIRIPAEPGDMLVWDSRMVHFGSRPDHGRPTIRSAIYICMMPAAFATPKQLAKRWQLFQAGRCTSHWPFGGRAFQDKLRTRGTPEERAENEAINARIDTHFVPNVRDPAMFGYVATTTK